jgi:hypothetical protein
MSEFLERLAIEFEADLKRLRERRRELRDEIAAVEEAEQAVATALRKLGLPRPPKPPAPTTTAVEPEPAAEPEPTPELQSVASRDGDAPSATEPEPHKVKRPGRRGWQYDRAPIRDWMRERGTFTGRELREEFALSTGTQHNILVEFRTQGTIEQVDRPTGTYRFAKPNGGGPNHKPRGEIVATTGTSVAPPPVAGTGRNRKMKVSSSKDVMEMVRVARQHGAEIMSTSHGFALTRPGYSGRVTVPSSPSKASLDKLRKKFRTTLGVPV